MLRYRVDHISLLICYISNSSVPVFSPSFSLLHNIRWTFICHITIVDGLSSAILLAYFCIFCITYFLCKTRKMYNSCVTTYNIITYGWVGLMAHFGRTRAIRTFRKSPKLTFLKQVIYMPADANKFAKKQPLYEPFLCCTNPLSNKS